MSVAWFAEHHLPQPGAVGLLCAGAGSPSALVSGATLPIPRAQWVRHA